MKKPTFKSQLFKTTFKFFLLNSINNVITKSARRKKFTHNFQSLDYTSRLGTVNYIKKGTGPAILLLHDINTASSLFEWYDAIEELSKNYTVYAIDLLGCGFSDRPAVTYTSYMYVLSIEKFIRNVIKGPAAIAANGLSAGLALLINSRKKVDISQVVLVSPTSPHCFDKWPSISDQIFKNTLNLPVLGLSLYNASSLSLTTFVKAYTSVAPDINGHKLLQAEKLFRIYYENAHMGGPLSTYLNSSIIFGFLFANLTKAIKSLSDYYIIWGYENPYRHEITQEFSVLNKSLHSIVINRAKYLPSFEQPKKVASAIHKILSGELNSK